ncbi:hypothetical protein N646_2502 [Vibrio alginolyticus NBRC 15630 = ATCC 17749]|uniref:Uncharacterized protein n=1 Tax=Vibrio alginolyticus (strain ATCC 17749 / DSM 2171 / NBRC 15630 / NCIMB 1903 / NCTC 12160 / XII-53) TaxID=1219076 RepID=A0A2I3CE68_VIBAX|nr:hypothetical protein N646_2502 [Vibrio alginolyticus NBRC 15630 = ATCC 17749]
MNVHKLNLVMRLLMLSLSRLPPEKRVTLAFFLQSLSQI